MNVMTATGNLGRDVEVRQAGGSIVANFSVAAKSGYGDREQTLWLDCSIWGSRAESRLIDYLKKGQMVAVSGELGTRERNGKTYLTLNVREVTLCGSRRDDGGGQAAPQQAASQRIATPPVAPPDLDDDIPF